MARLLPLILYLVAAEEASVSPDGSIRQGGPEYLQDGYCTSKPEDSEVDKKSMAIGISSMDCAAIMEFIYISRLKVFEELQRQLLQVNETSSHSPPSVIDSLRNSSRAASLLSAHSHLTLAVASQRAACFSEHVRLVLVVSLRRMKTLVNGQVQQLWFAAEGWAAQDESGRTRRMIDWLSEVVGLLEADIRTFKTVLHSWQTPTPEEARYYSHEADGRYSTMESLRKETFEEWTLDKGLVQSLLRHVFDVDASVADFGAGSGHYSRWLNDTGLVTAFAFDGSVDISLVTRGVVAGLDLIRPFELWRRFDWILCLEVAEHIPADMATAFLKNLDAHGTEGLIISWAKPGLHGLGTTNPLTEAQVLSLIQRETGFVHLNEDLTRKVRAAATLPHLAETLLVLTRNPPPGSVNLLKSDAPAGCTSEEGWIYAGNDVQMFSAVSSAAACCELCNSHEQCKFWTWSGDESHKELCWIKATREYRISHVGFISGTRDTNMR